MKYSLIIPVYNEINTINRLLHELESLKLYIDNEIIIIDDGSNDGTGIVLGNYKFIKLVKLANNSGKGTALRKGLEIALYDKIIIFDGDMELYPKDILKLMILNKEKNINCVFGIRKKHLSLRYPFWSLGNYILTVTFNMINKSNLKDSLCCAKSFYKEFINHENLNSKGFDIDIEIASLLIENTDSIKTIPLEYDRRTKKEGKKLRITHGWLIFKRLSKKILK